MCRIFLYPHIGGDGGAKRPAVILCLGVIRIRAVEATAGRDIRPAIRAAGVVPQKRIAAVLKPGDAVALAVERYGKHAAVGIAPSPGGQREIRAPADSAGRAAEAVTPLG